MSTRDRRKPMIEVRHSPVHGYGVFALRRIRKGTTVIEYLGDRITHEEADERYADKDAKDNHTFLFTVDSKTVIDAGRNGNEARFINHGCDPNCESGIMAKRVFIDAIRTIQPGEELVYDYQITRDPDDPDDVDEIFACRCGAPGCRGSMLEPKKPPRKKPQVAQARLGPADDARGRRRRAAAGEGVPGALARLGNRAVRDIDRRLLDRILEQLRADGIAVSDGFLPPFDVDALAECAALRRARGEFLEARIGADSSLQRREDVRGDLICWLAGALFPAETRVLGALEQLRLCLNEGAYLGLLDLEIHYAWYPPGAAYSRHVDRPPGRSARRVSLVLYLNERRSPADGGALRIRATTVDSATSSPWAVGWCCFCRNRASTRCCSRKSRGSA